MSSTDSISWPFIKKASLKFLTRLGSLWVKSTENYLPIRSRGEQVKGFALSVNDKLGGDDGGGMLRDSRDQVEVVVDVKNMDDAIAGSGRQ